MDSRIQQRPESANNFKMNLSEYISIKHKEEYENYNLAEYENELGKHKSRIFPDRSAEDRLRGDYSGRELFEMIQNAEDQLADTIEIELDKYGHLHIRNDGPRPFSNEGLFSVLRPDQSPKKKQREADERLIGNKGLGIRSLLNWSDGMTLHSNGVKVSFSQSIAKEKWEYLKHTNPGISNWVGIEEMPLAVLSVPEISQDTITEEDVHVKHEKEGDLWTTEIEVECHENVLEDVKCKMKNLQPEVLLFMNNLSRINLKITHGETWENHLSREHDGATGLEILRGADDDLHYLLNCVKKDIEWNKGAELRKDKAECKIGVCINRLRECDYVYSYFPTRVAWNLPCVLHADFNLNTSRDQINNDGYNDILLSIAGKLLLDTAEQIARRGEFSSDLRLIPLKMINFEESVKKNLRGLVKVIDDRKRSAIIIPTVDGGFSSTARGIYFHEGLGLDTWLSNHQAFLSELPNLSHYIEADTFELLGDMKKGIKAIQDCVEELRVIGHKELCADDRAQFIQILAKAGETGLKSKFDVIHTADNKIIGRNEKAYLVNVRKGTKALPSSIKLNVVHPELESALIRLYADNEKFKTERDRHKEIHDRIQNITDISYIDFSRIKQEIESQSKEFSLPELLEVLEWAFKRWNSDSNSEEYMDYMVERKEDLKTGYRSDKFMLRNRIGEAVPACGLVLYAHSECADRFKLHETIREWIGQDQDKKDFVIEALGIREYIPLDYISLKGRNDELDYRSKVKAETNASKEIWYFVINEDFSNCLDDKNLLRLIIKDSRFQKQVLGYRWIEYHNYNWKKAEASISYATFQLWKRAKSIFSKIEDYAVNAEPIFNEDILDIRKLSSEFNVRKEAINDVLLLLGAVEDPYELSFGTIYRKIQERDKPRGTPSFYKYCKDVLHHKVTKKGETLVDTDKLRTVWAQTTSGSAPVKISKEKAYYFDNTTFPKRMLAQLPRILLGSRAGAEQVRNYFGVKVKENVKFSDSDISCPDPDGNLSRRVKDILNKRFRLLVATSLTEKDNKESTIKDKASSIRRFVEHLNIVPYIKYVWNGEQCTGEAGDVLFLNNKYYICTDKTDAVELFGDPDFCSNLASGLCLALNIAVENEKDFRHVLQISQLFVDREWMELDESLRNSITKSIGISEDEINFWKAVDIHLSENEDADLSRRRKTICEAMDGVWLPDPLCDVDEMSGGDYYRMVNSMEKRFKDVPKVYSAPQLNDFYKRFLLNSLPGIETALLANTHAKFSRLPKEELTRAKVFEMANEIMRKKKLLRKCADEYPISGFVLTEDLEDDFRRFIITELGIEIEYMEAAAPSTLQEYHKIIEDNRIEEAAIDFPTRCLSWFPGLENEFQQCINREERSIEAIDVTSLPEEINLNLTTFSPSKHTLNSHGGNSGAIPSARERAKLGLIAEELVKKKLSADTHLYKNIQDVRKNTEYHCDFLYTKIGEDEPRYLEVKNAASGRIFLSHDERKKGIENWQQYDLALVHDGNIEIIEQAFKPDSVLMKSLKPHDWEVNVEFNRKE